MFAMKNWGSEKICFLSVYVLYQGRNAWSRIYVIFILHLGRIYSSPPFVLLIKYESHSSCQLGTFPKLLIFDPYWLAVSPETTGVQCRGNWGSTWPGGVQKMLAWLGRLASHSLSEQPWRIYLQDVCPHSYKVWFYEWFQAPLKSQQWD